MKANRGFEIIDISSITMISAFDSCALTSSMRFPSPWWVASSYLATSAENAKVLPERFKAAVPVNAVNKTLGMDVCFLT